MGGDRSTRHADQRPTKEAFYDVTAVSGGAAAFGGLGGFYGADIDGDAEYAYIQVLTPHDFNELVDLMLVVIPTATVANMTMRLVTNYCKPNEPYSQHNKQVDDKTFTAVQNTLTEVNIKDMVDLPSNNLSKNDYLGIQVSRQAGDTLDAVIIGAKLRYQ